MSHECHAERCEVDVPPRMLFCPKHWAMTPKNLQDLIWANYVEGQEIRKDPTDAYLDAQELVVAFVDSLERGEPTMPIWKVLSLTQPWASLVVWAFKAWETRSKRSKYVGPLAIHASAGFPKECRELCYEEPFRTRLKQMGYTKPSDLPTGQILGVVTMRGCERTEVAATMISPEEYAFGNYGPDRFAYALEGARRLAKPLPAKGALGIWTFAGELGAFA